MAADQTGAAAPVPSAPRRGEGALFTEHLRVPARWWAYAVLVVLTVLLAAAAALEPAAALALTVLAALAAAAWLVSLSSFAVTVRADGLHVGAAHLPATAIGPAAALDRDQVRRARGAGSDPRAYYPLRSYVPTAVQVVVADADDPVPFWLVSTRHPQRLASALSTARADGGTSPGGPGRPAG
jgi:hypothetical protein